MTLDKRILTGFTAGIAVGFVSRAGVTEWLRQTLIAVEPIGTAFIRLISMVVVPLVIASVFVGVASLGDVRALGRVGGKTLCYFLVTTLAGAIIGVTVAMVARAGEGLSSADRNALAGQVGTSAAPAVPSETPTIAQILLDMIPQNPFASAAQGGGDLLPLIIAVCIFAAAATVIDVERRRAVVEFFDAVNAMAMVVIGWLMRLAPFAVFVLIAATVARSGW